METNLNRKLAADLLIFSFSLEYQLVLLCNTRLTRKQQLTLLPDGVASRRSADGAGVRQLMVELAPAGDVTRLEEAAGSSSSQLVSNSGRQSLQVNRGSQDTFSLAISLSLSLLSISGTFYDQPTCLPRIPARSHCQACSKILVC